MKLRRRISTTNEKLGFRSIAKANKLEIVNIIGSWCRNLRHFNEDHRHQPKFPRSSSLMQDRLIYVLPVVLLLDLRDKPWAKKNSRDQNLTLIMFCDKGKAALTMIEPTMNWTDFLLLSALFIELTVE